MKKYFILLLALILSVTACKPSAGTTATAEPGITPPADGTLPSPVVNITPAPDAIDTATDFLQKWTEGDYAGMYGLISGTSRDAHAEEEFADIYENASYNMTLNNIEVGILSSLVRPTSATVAYHAKYETNLLGNIERDLEMQLTMESGSWKIEWEEGLIVPELRGGNHLALNVTWPSRANIYDRNGQMIATNTNAVALGVVPVEINPDEEGELVYQLSRLTGLTQPNIRALIEAANPNWYVAIGEATSIDVQERYDTLSGLDGLQMTQYSGRYYEYNGVSPQVIGYVLSIFPEQMEEYRRKGYAGDEKVGAAGLESWGEEFLAGSPGASLYVVGADGTIITRIAQTDASPSENVYTTLDRDLQIATQRAIQGFIGAAVVMEVSTGRILAMASSPSLDPNLFSTDNRNSSELLADQLNDGTNRLLNRATQSAYPLGSVFKIVTMAAALESGLYTTATTYDCQYEFNELPGATFYDWTKEKEVAASGMLTLPEGLMRSCNPYFYHIGLDLYRRMGNTYLTNIALGFGLGSATGIDQVAEVTGNVPTPVTEGDAVQQGIGQGELLVTPLQVADFIAAVANGGTLYRPQVVEKIVKPNGDASLQFAAEVRNTLPISEETLTEVQNAMSLVVNNRRGTAYQKFFGLTIPVVGKTGTATVGGGLDSHAWFAGYSKAQNASMPDIAVVVFIENGGEGSEIGAPIFRRIIEAYFGQTLTQYPWESSLYITRTPTPIGTEAP